MMAVDTSALVAVALDEPQGQACRVALGGENKLVMSAGTMAEALIVAHHRGFGDALATLIARFGIEIVPVSAQTAVRMVRAHLRWGRGQGTAGLNSAIASPTNSP